LKIKIPLFLLSLTTLCLLSALPQSSAVSSSTTNCTSVDLTDLNFSGAVQPRKLFSEKRNQRDSNICVAFSSADVVSQAIGEPVSELYISWLSNRDRTVKQDQAVRRLSAFGLSYGGTGVTAFSALSDEPVCLESAIPFSVFGDIPRKGLFGGKSLADIFALLQSQIGRNSSLDAVPETAVLKKLFPSLTTVQIGDAIGRWTEQTNNRTMFELAKQHCTNVGALRRLKNPPKIQSAQGSELVALLNHFLDEGHVARLDVKQSYLLKTNPVARERGHSVTVLGRREMNGHCLIKVRDSELPSCDTAPQGQFCDFTNGTYWLKVDSVGQGALEVIGLE
jgi:hypothetical protein